MTDRRATLAAPERPLSNLLHRATQVLDHMLLQRDTMRDVGLTARQYAVLCAIDRHEGGSQATLASVTSIDRSTLSDIMRRLMRKGWVVRRRSRQDNRAYTIYLSAEGVAILGKAHDMVADVDNQLVSMLPLHLRDSFLAGLNTLANADAA